SVRRRGRVGRRQAHPAYEEPGRGLVHADDRRHAAARAHARARVHVVPQKAQDRRGGDAMRGALIHGVLLAVMLVYGYRTWTRDKSAEPTTGNVVLWEKTEGDLVSIEYKAKKKIVKIERKPEGYWWGADTTIEMKPKPGAGSNAGSAAGSGSGAGS